MTAAVATTHQLWLSSSFGKRWRLTKNPKWWVNPTEALRGGQRLSGGSNPPPPQALDWGTKESFAWQQSGNCQWGWKVDRDASDLGLFLTHSRKILQVCIVAGSKSAGRCQSWRGAGLDETLFSTLSADLLLPCCTASVGWCLTCAGMQCKDYFRKLWKWLSSLKLCGMASFCYVQHLLLPEFAEIAFVF